MFKMTDRHFSEMSHASVVDRYFTKRYVTGANNNCLNVTHSRVCHAFILGDNRVFKTWESPKAKL